MKLLDKNAEYRSDVKFLQHGRTEIVVTPE